MFIRRRKWWKLCCLLIVYCRQGMFAGSRLQGNFVEILCLRLIGVVEMPEDRGIGIAVSQFHRDKAFAAVQLLGQLDVGVHRRVDELHGLKESSPQPALKGGSGLYSG